MAETTTLPPVLLAIINYGLKVGLPLLAAFLLARYGIVLPVQEAADRVTAAVERQTAALERLPVLATK